MHRFGTSYSYSCTWVLMNNLRVCEVCTQHLPDVLCVREVESGVHFVQDVDRSRFKQQHGQDQRKCHQRPETHIQTC